MGVGGYFLGVRNFCLPIPECLGVIFHNIPKTKNWQSASQLLEFAFFVISNCAVGNDVELP